MRRLWCQHALLPSGIADGVLVTIDNGLIAQLERITECPPDAEQLDGVTTPGFANAHSHAFHRALRGRTHRGRGDFWVWRDQMYALAGRLTPENYMPLARAVFAEMLMAGYTAVGEFHYVHHAADGKPYADSNAMGNAIIEAARQAGIRLTLLDACYLQGGTGQPVSEQQRRFSDGSAAAWMSRIAALRSSLADRSVGDTVRIGAAIHSVRAVDAGSIALVARFAAQHDMPLHAHVSEQVAENEQIATAFGCSPTQLLAQQGALSARFTAVHATHLTNDDITLYSATGSVCCFCPSTERDLADGIGPSRGLREAGVKLAIGSDQHAVVDPFEEMRGIELDERLLSMRRGTHPADDLVAAGTVNGYRSLGWHVGGAIEVGALADLTTISTDSVRLAGAPTDALVDAVVFCATASDVHNVIVAGHTVVRGGRHVSIDVADELSRAISALYEDAR